MDKNGVIIISVVVVLGLLRLGWWLYRRSHPRGELPLNSPPRRPLANWQRKLYTVYVFAKLNTRRFFRDRTAIFFTVAFPVIFLFVFGGLFGKNSGVSFKVAVLNQSRTQVARQVTTQLGSSKFLKVSADITTLPAAKERMSRNEIDATIVLPPDFGQTGKGQKYPSGQALILYDQNNAQGGQALASVLQGEFKTINAKLITLPEQPFTVAARQVNDKSLNQFDYTFAGLLGFSIIGMGIFGPINIFPELKKQGILRRFHTTPLRVWQYFLSMMISQAAIGLFTIAVLFVAAIAVFHLKVVGSYVELAAFMVMGIVTILGIGLALGGWAKNERQAAPLSNIVVFPMMFLSGTFFPRYLMPEWLQNVSAFLPLTPVIDGIRLIATEGKHLADILPQLGLTSLWAVIIYMIAFRVFRWE